jgi:hypothetical protein
MHGDRVHKSTGLDKQSNHAVAEHIHVLIASLRGDSHVNPDASHFVIPSRARNDNYTRYGLPNPKMI